MVYDRCRSLRSPQKTRRKSSSREPYDRVLIVCEGKKTEPQYFRDLVDRYRLSTINIQIVGEGSDPKTLVKKAKRLVREARDKKDPYNNVYCVFDRDGHATFDSACQEAKTSKTIQTIRSWPCFEFWLLLHFDYSRQPYSNSGGKTASQNCVEALKKKLNGYTKSEPGIFQRLEDKLNQAITNSEQAWTDAKDTGESNPSTEVHILVTYLRSLKKKLSRTITL